MTPRSRQIAIAGAGIAGLTAALAFAQRGFHATILERSGRLEEVGAGLQLSPNATRILDRLGVLATLRPSAVQPEAIAIRSARTLRLLTSVPLGEGAARRWRAPYLTVHRADLQAALLATVSQHPHIELLTGAAVRDVAFGDHGVTLSFDREGRVEEIACGLALGADGVWSTLRGLGGQAGPSRYTGYLAWRAVLHPDRASGAETPPADRVTAWLHPGFHLVAYPVRAGEAINLVAVTRAPASAQGWSNAADPAQLEAAMRGASPELASLVAHAAPWTTWPIHEVPQDRPWTLPAGLALIGDAAHAMSPYSAQGAAMAIEDAATLAAVVERHAGDVGAALARYETMRRPRVKRVAARGRFNRFTWHAAGPVAFVRDRVLGFMPPQRLAADLDWLYGWDPDEEMASPG